METVRKLDEIVFRSDLYPRIKHSQETVEKYSESLEQLPPIEINQHNELIDGWHRWQAHKTNGHDEIPVIVTETESEARFMELAIERNAIHGLQLSQADKQRLAWQLYLTTPRKERVEKKRYLRKLLSVGRSTIDEWLSDIDTKTADEQRKEAFGLWLACHTQQEIAGRLEVTQPAVNGWIRDFINISEVGKFYKNAQNRATFNDGIDSEGNPNWPVPLYNYWTTPKLSNEVRHFGNSEQRWVENLLYLFTEPLDIVVDPFAGGGSTIDVCRKRLRRYLVSDRLPIESRAQEIRPHDIANGPIRTDWSSVRLVYLDPPYWKQAEGQYSDDPQDFANMPLEQFNASLATVIKAYASKMSHGYIALIIQPTQWKSENRAFIDHVGDMLKAVKLPVEMRIAAPYSTEQYNAQQVNWAKQNRKLLVVTREIVVWRVGE